MPIGWDIADGQVEDFNFIDKFGCNGTTGTVYEECWSAAVPYPWQAAAEIMKVSSNSVEDDPDKGGGTPGTGAHEIEIQGLDINGNILTEVVVLNGTADVATANAYYRVFRMKITKAGTVRANVGLVKAENFASAVIWAQIDPLVGQTLMAIWTVPRGFSFHLTEWWVAESSAQSTDIGIFVRGPGSITSWNAKRLIRLKQTSLVHRFEYPLIIDSGSDVAIRAQATGGSSVVTGGFSGFYHPER
jgi:hypothetical protein